MHNSEVHKPTQDETHWVPKEKSCQQENEVRWHDMHVMESCLPHKHTGWPFLLLFIYIFWGENLKLINVFLHSFSHSPPLGYCCVNLAALCGTMLSCTRALGKQEKTQNTKPSCSVLFSFYTLSSALLLETHFAKTPKVRNTFQAHPISPLHLQGLPHHLLKSLPRVPTKQPLLHKRNRNIGKTACISRKLIAVQENFQPRVPLAAAEGWHQQLAPRTKIFSTSWCQTHLSYTPLAGYPWSDCPEIDWSPVYRINEANYKLCYQQGD